MKAASPQDVPSPFDLRNCEVAKNWAEAAMVKRPWREEFFHAIVQELNFLNSSDSSVLELGSGPGFLAQRILEALSNLRYVALDFSPAMHELAKGRLGPLTKRVQFIETDFRLSNWTAGLPSFDAVVSVQSVHEVRHKRHAPTLYGGVRRLLREKGAFLVCDHFVGEGGMTDTSLYMTPQEQLDALGLGGFTDVREILQKGGLVLFRAAA